MISRVIKCRAVCLVLLLGLTWFVMEGRAARAADDLLSGRWRGGWSSHTTGHAGRLNARFRRIDSQHVRANFHGTFARVVPFFYRPVLNVVHEEPGLMVLQGERRIPLGGTFSYEAVVSGDSFEATYRSRRDSGQWRMTRH